MPPYLHAAGPTYVPRRILLVEDNHDGRVSLQNLLSLHGHAVTAAADGEEGLRMGLETRPDVAILDIKMPKMGGRLSRSVCGELWARPSL